MAQPGGRRRPAQDRPDPREQLLVDDRPRQEVVRAALEGSDSIDGVGSRRADHDHGDVAIPRAARLTLAQPRAEVELGQHDEVGTRALGKLERLAVEAGLEDVEAVARELPLEIAARVGLRLGEEQGGIHPAKLASRSRGPPDVL